jgi:toxin CcdB
MQGDAYANPDGSADYAPYLLDVQADLLSDLDTRVVVPLVRRAAFGRPASRLHPEFTIGSERVVMATHLIAAIRCSGLGPLVASLVGQRDAMIAAVDVLLAGV